MPASRVAIDPLHQEEQLVPGVSPREEGAYRGPVALPSATGDQYVDRLSGEPACMPRKPHAGLSQQRMGGYPLLCDMQRVDSRSAHE